MDRLQSMAVFVRAAELGSFAKAGTALNLSPPAVTRAIAQLEARVGTRLFTRTTRSLRLTEAGARYLADCTRILAEIEEAEDAAAGSYAAPRGNLHMTSSVIFGRNFIAPILREFIDLHPAVTVHALFIDRIVHMLDEGIDAAIRIGPLPDSSLTAIRAGSIRRVLCGAPSYFAKHGFPRHPKELMAHRLVVGAGGTLQQLDWHFVENDKPLVIQIKPAIVFSTNDAAIDSAVSGWALTRVLSYQIAPHLETGQLQTVLREYEPEPWPVHVVHHEGRRASAKIRTFVDFAVERLRGNALLKS